MEVRCLSEPPMSSLQHNRVAHMTSRYFISTIAFLWFTVTMAGAVFRFWSWCEYRRLFAALCRHLVFRPNIFILCDLVPYSQGYQCIGTKRPGTAIFTLVAIRTSDPAMYCTVFDLLRADRQTDRQKTLHYSLIQALLFHGLHFTVEHCRTCKISPHVHWCGQKPLVRFAVVSLRLCLVPEVTTPNGINRFPQA
jgi:hypothetical protein